MRLLNLILCAALPWLGFGAPTVSRQSSTQLDAKGIYFVSYDGLVNVESFQQSGVVSYNGYQYAGWYTSTRYAILARRQLPSRSWSTLQLPHQLSRRKDPYCLGFPFHHDLLCEIGCEPGWEPRKFLVDGIPIRLGANYLGRPQHHQPVYISPVFDHPDNKLQLVYRSAVSGNGVVQIAEYSGSSWSNLGGFTSATGTYTGPNGVASTARNLYINGVTYSSSGRLHTSGTWRENNAGVLCASGGLANHDTIWLYSDDRGRTWYNNGGAKVATTGSSTVSVSTSGIIVDTLDVNHGLVNQESQRPTRQTNHTLSSRMFPADSPNAYLRTRRIGHHTPVEIPFAIGSFGRSQIVMDASDNIYVVLPFVKIVTASKSSGWTDWTLAYDGVAAGLGAFGEVTVDRPRVKSEGVLSVLYQVKSSGTTPSAVMVIDFKLNG
ncbi:BNR repeat-containing family member [Ceratobasidium sp. AG-Ba]|nr:BNR repeat-containing family member [Ceratobasidium sp. AG-Ba]